MNHPSHETWMAYLYDELPATERSATAAHLDACPTCREAFARWQTTMAALDEDVIVPSRPAAPAWRTVTPWALAASVALMAGFTAGRLMGPSRTEMQAELTRVRESVAAELRDQYREDLREVARASVAAASAENRELVTRVVGEFNKARAADQSTWIATLRRLEERHDNQYGVLRAGMRDLALRTQSGFRQTEDNLNLLANYLPASDDTGGETIPASGTGKDK